MYLYLLYARVCVYVAARGQVTRWTDGYSWSDSYHPGGRVLEYREAEMKIVNGKPKKVSTRRFCNGRLVLSTTVSLSSVIYNTNEHKR